MPSKVQPFLPLDCCPHCGGELRGPDPTPEQRGYLFGVLIEIFREHCGYARREEAYDAAVRWLLTFPWQQMRPSLANGAIDRDGMAEVIDRLSAAIILDLQRTVPDPEPDPVRRYLARAGVDLTEAA